MRASNILSYFIIFLIASCAYGSSPEIRQSPSQKKWSTLTEKERNDLRKEYKEWVTLPEATKTHLKQLYQEYLKLQPAEKLRVEQNYAKFLTLPPQTQELIKKYFARFSQLSPEEQKRRIQILEQARQNMSDIHEQVEDRGKKSKVK